MMRKLVPALVAALIATPAIAGGTKVQMTVGPEPQTCTQVQSCSSGTCTGIGGSCSVDTECMTCSIGGDHCTANTDCVPTLLSPKSKLQVSGDGTIKVAVKGVLGAGGTPVTTDGVVDTADDYILPLAMLSLGSPDKYYSLKLELSGGSGAATVNIGAGLSAGAVLSPFAYLQTPPTSPASCPGTNSPDDVIAREGNSACNSGRVVGVGGLVMGNAATKVKESLVPMIQTCVTSNECISGMCGGFGVSCSANSDCNQCSLFSSDYCTTNNDCNTGAPSPKSKIQMSGAGDLKVTIKGALDAAGQPLTTDGVVGSADDYILLLGAQPYSGPATYCTVKVDFENGTAKITADVSGALATGTNPVWILAALATPPDVPANCPGTNSAEDIVARGGNTACQTGTLRALAGILAAP